MKAFLRYASVALLAGGLSAVAQASVVRVDFQGFVTIPGFSAVAAGDAFSGSVYYMAPDAPFSSSSDSCALPASCAEDFYRMPLAFQVNIDGSMITTASPSVALIIVQDSADPNADDSIEFGSNAVHLSINGPLASQQSPLFDLLAVEFVGPSSVLSSTQIPVVFPDLSLWSSGARFELQTFSSFAPEVPDRELVGDITSLTSTVVAEPSVFVPVLLAFGLGVASRNRRFPDHGSRQAEQR